MSLRDRFETLHLISPVAGWTGTVTLVPALPPPDRTRIAVYSAILSSGATAAFNFADTTGPISGTMNLLAETTMLLEQNTNTDPWFLTRPGQPLQIVVTTGTVTGDIYVLRVPGDYPPQSSVV